MRVRPRMWWRSRQYASRLPLHLVSRCRGRTLIMSCKRAPLRGTHPGPGSHVSTGVCGLGSTDDSADDSAHALFRSQVSSFTNLVRGIAQSTRRMDSTTADDVWRFQPWPHRDRDGLQGGRCSSIHEGLGRLLGSQVFAEPVLGLVTCEGMAQLSRTSGAITISERARAAQRVYTAADAG